MDILGKILENDQLKADIAAGTDSTPEDVGRQVASLLKLVKDVDSDAHFRSKLTRAINSGKPILEIQELVAQQTAHLPQTNIGNVLELGMKFVNEAKEYFENVLRPSGLYLGDDMKELNADMNGLHTGGLMYVIGGRGSSGKTSWLRNVSINLPLYNPEQVFVIYVTLDDSIKEMMPHLISQLSIYGGAARGLDAQQVAIPVNLQNGQRELLTSSWKKMTDLMQDSYMILDSSSVSTLTDILRINDFVCNKHHNKKVILIIDNFHDIQHQGMELRERFMYTAIKLKESVVEHKNTLLMSVQLNKLRSKQGNETRRPIREDISETAEIDYKSNLVMLAHNEIDAGGEQNAEYREVTYPNDPAIPVFKPVIEIAFQKNKIVPTCKGTKYFRFVGNTSKMAQIEYARVSSFKRVGGRADVTTAAALPVGASRRRATTI